MYITTHQAILLETGYQSIKHGLETGRPLPIQVESYPQDLQQKRATFVTLKINDELRGCIGVLDARRTLIEDVADNAFSAAFKDNRFSPLTRDEFELIEISISVLSPSEPMEFKSEEDLLAQLQPGVDGLILQDGIHRSTFLPSVWENISDAKEFLQNLKIKAGLPADYWSDSIQFRIYTTESIP